MTFALRAGDHVVTAGSPLLKARDAKPFTEGVALLAEARDLRDAAKTELADVRAQAVADGRAAGLTEVHDRLADAIAEMARSVDVELSARRADIAAAAFAGARAIIGSFDQADATARMAERAVDKIGAKDAIIIAVAPSIAAAVRERLADHAQVTVREDPSAAPYDCVLSTSDGRVIASLPLQLDALAARWGVPA